MLPFYLHITPWVVEKEPMPAQIIPITCGLFVLLVLLAWLSLKLYDEPVRAWLKKKILLKK